MGVNYALAHTLDSREGGEGGMIAGQAAGTAVSIVFLLVRQVESPHELRQRRLRSAWYLALSMGAVGRILRRLMAAGRYEPVSGAVANLDWREGKDPLWRLRSGEADELSESVEETERARTSILFQLGAWLANEIRADVNGNLRGARGRSC